MHIANNTASGLNFLYLIISMLSRKYFVKKACTFTICGKIEIEFYIEIINAGSIMHHISLNEERSCLWFNTVLIENIFDIIVMVIGKQYQAPIDE